MEPATLENNNTFFQGLWMIFLRIFEQQIYIDIASGGLERVRMEIRKEQYTFNYCMPRGSTTSHMEMTLAVL
jgi:hypothetical protein